MLLQQRSGAGAEAAAAVGACLEKRPQAAAWRPCARKCSSWVRRSSATTSFIFPESPKSGGQRRSNARRTACMAWGVLQLAAPPLPVHSPNAHLGSPQHARSQYNTIILRRSDGAYDSLKRQLGAAEDALEAAAGAPLGVRVSQLVVSEAQGVQWAGWHWWQVCRLVALLQAAVGGWAAPPLLGAGAAGHSQTPFSHHPHLHLRICLRRARPRRRASARAGRWTWWPTPLP